MPKRPKEKAHHAPHIWGSLVFAALAAGSGAFAIEAGSASDNTLSAPSGKHPRKSEVDEAAGAAFSGL
jgi:hypothetical protein